MLTEIPEVKFIRYMRSQLEKLKYIFTKKLHHAYKDVLGYKT